MVNCYVNQNKKIEQTVIDAMKKLERVANGTSEAGIYWIDDTHNIFCFINDNGDDDRWIEIHYELCSHEKNIIGDLMVISTDDVNYGDLNIAVKDIVNSYYGIRPKRNFRREL